MPRAEVGSSKHLGNKMKAKGLQRLRWYCQVCERQMRDANGFKCHVQSESHVRQMQVVGEDPKKFIERYSRDFHQDFTQLLRVAHGEKFVDANRFYQEYIANKEHIHMTATKWPSLTEYVKYLGREGICNVKEDDKGALMIAWRDNSPEALRRRQAVKDAEMLEARNEADEDKMLKRQIKAAKEEKAKAGAKQKLEAQQKKPETRPTEEKKGEEKESSGDTGEPKPTDAPKPEAAPVKFSLSLKSKTLQNGTKGPAALKKTSVFKRMRQEDGEGKATKKIKL